MFQKYYHGEGIAVNVLEIWSSLRIYVSEILPWGKYSSECFRHLVFFENIAMNILCFRNTTMGKV